MSGVVNGAMGVNLKGIICKYDMVGRMHNDVMTAKLEEIEKRSTNRALEDTTLDIARRGEMALHGCDN